MTQRNDHRGAEKILLVDNEPGAVTLYLVEEAEAERRPEQLARWLGARMVQEAPVNDPTHIQARRLKAAALIELAERQVNAIARNYYLTSAQFLLKDLPPR